MRSQGKPAVAEGEFDDGEMMRPDTALVAQGHTLQRQQTAYSTAISVQRPRKRADVIKACVEEAGLAGEGFFYAWTVKSKNGGKELIEGTSIDGAMIMARNWGNCALPVTIDSEGPSHWVLKAAFVDLETGFNDERLFRQRKSQTTGKMDPERSLDIAFQIGQSKAQRNVIMKSLPHWLTEQCLEAAKDSAEGKYKDVARKAPGFIKRFAELGVTQAQLEKKLSRPLDKWEPRDLMTLAAIGRAIGDRQTTVEQEFSDDEVAAPSATEGTKPSGDPVEGEPPESGTSRGAGSMREPGEDER